LPISTFSCTVGGSSISDMTWLIRALVTPSTFATSLADA
jgi:hypothetical protein